MAFMKYLEIFFYIALMFFVVPIRYNRNDVEDQFVNYLKVFNKSYSGEEYEKRLKAFEKSLNDIQWLNSNRTNIHSAQYGLTRYSDVSSEEFHKHLLGNKNSLRKMRQAKAENALHARRKRSSDDFSLRNLELPDKIDWRDFNAVTKVRNQKNCGACWAFSVVELVESMNAIKYKNLIDLSVQEMIDCSKEDFGCDGGDIITLLEWLTKYKIPVYKENQYPLQLENQQCKMKDNKDKGVIVMEYENTRFDYNEAEMLTYLAHQGPLAAAVNAQSWQNYIGGVMQVDKCISGEDNLNHAVQIVGFNIAADIPYYIVRNSWGTDFGYNGYAHVAIGNYTCGLGIEVAALEVL